MKYCIKETIDHVNSRVQFGKKLREFGNVHKKLTDMIIQHYVTESIVYMLASNVDGGVPEFQLEAAIAKVVASENAWQVCDEAIQLHGGIGYMRDCGLERVLRDLRIFRIFECANDIMRMFVALTGMQYAGKHLQQLSNDIKSGSVTSLFSEVKRRAFRLSIYF
uniref:Acyl-CoA dehydrogenase/oxidase C-terminal domain-containing protein n=1 Tax=Ditylenchus dipsaci TaxID=166011 RepID=A0A915D3B3_9BILA